MDTFKSVLNKGWLLNIKIKNKKLQNNSNNSPWMVLKKLTHQLVVSKGDDPLQARSLSSWIPVNRFRPCVDAESVFSSQFQVAPLPKEILKVSQNHMFLVGSVAAIMTCSTG